jgi:hypothetical protein
MYKAAAFLVLLAIAIGCSDSSEPPPSGYPLTLIIVSDSIVANTALFNFRVEKDTKPVAGAKLRRTDYYVSGKTKTSDLGIQSDSAGNYKRVIMILGDSISAVAYQATRDSLTSNFITWRP